MSFGITASQGVGTGSGSSNSMYANAVLADSPILFLQFDEMSGTLAADSSGNGRDGTYDNSPYPGMYSVIPGSSGRSVRFENGSGGPGPKQQVSVPYGSWMDTAEMTVTFPCFISTGNFRLIATRYGEPGNDWSWFVYNNNNTFQFHYRSSGGVNTNIDSGVVAIQGRRYFVAAYAGPSGCGIRVYDETGLLGSATGAGGTVNPSTRPIVLMDAATQNYSSTGYLDDLAVFDTVLSTARLDTYAAAALAPDGVTWINRSTGGLMRNGTNTQTINFTPATAGSLLVAVVTSPTVQTAVTAGWTKRLSPTDSVELAVFTRNANAGDSSLQVSMSASDFPLVYTVYEFPPGSAWYAGNSVQQNVTNATLSGLPGNGVTVFQAGASPRGAGQPNGNTQYWYFWRTDTNQNVLHDGVVGGIYLGIGYFVNFPDAVADITVPADQKVTSTATYETVMFAISTP